MSRHRKSICEREGNVYMKDQKERWNNAYSNEEEAWSEQPNDFAYEVLPFFRKGSKVLELGCGFGRDAIFFAKNGFEIAATDFSNHAIQKAEQKAKRQGLSNKIQLRIQDIGQPFQFGDETFDIVYAYLSLHYFTDSVTTFAISEVERILKPDGLFCAACRSIEDPLYGKGTIMEKDVYILNGHIRHFFSKDYLREKIRNFEILRLWSGEYDNIRSVLFHGRKAAIVKVIAKISNKGGYLGPNWKD